MQRQTDYGYTYASAEDKGITLHCAAVENYTYDSVNNFTADARYGRGILIFTYTIGFVLTIMLAPILISLLFKIIKDLFDVSNEEDFDISYSKLILAGASTISLVHTFLSVGIAFYQLTKYRNVFNEFDRMKSGYLPVLLIWLFTITAAHTIYYDSNKDKLQNCMLKIAGFLAAFSLSAFTGLLMLSFAPTILLLFAYPVDISSLLALHVALFYSTTIVLAVFFRSVREWIVHHYSIVKNIISCSFCNKTQQKLAKKDNCNKCIIFAGMFLHILTGMVLVALLPLTYVCLILLYQFVVARSEANQLAYSNLSTYVPSLVIAVFGFIIKKGAFDLPRHKKMKQQKEEDEKKVSDFVEDIWKVYCKKNLNLCKI